MGSTVTVRFELNHKGGEILRTAGVKSVVNSAAASMAGRANAMSTEGSYGYDSAKPSKSKRRLPHAIVYTGDYAACVDNSRNNTLLRAVR